MALGDSLDILKMKTVEARDLKVVTVTQITQLKELNLSNVSFLMSNLGTVLFGNKYPLLFSKLNFNFLRLSHLSSV